MLGDFFLERREIGDGKPGAGQGIVHREDGGVVRLERAVGLHHVQIRSKKRNIKTMEQKHLRTIIKFNTEF